MVARGKSADKGVVMGKAVFLWESEKTSEILGNTESIFKKFWEWDLGM